MSTNHTIKADPSLGIRNIHAFKARLETAVRTHPSLEIDVQDLKDLDISVVQTLFSAQKLAAKLGHTFIVTAPPGSAFRSVLERGGFIPSRH